MDNSTTTTSGAVETTSAHAHVWRDRLQPGTRLLADLVVTVQGTTLPTCGAGKAGLVGRVAVQGIAPAFAITTTSNATTSNYMDVPPFRTGRPPV